LKTNDRGCKKETKSVGAKELALFGGFERVIWHVYYHIGIQLVKRFFGVGKGAVAEDYLF